MPLQHEQNPMNIASQATRQRLRFPLSLLCAAMFLSGCASDPVTQEPDMPVQLMRTGQESVAPGDDVGTDEVRKSGCTLLEQKGSGTFVTSLPQARAQAGEKTVNVNFENAPLVDVLAAILGDMLKVPYSLEGDVGGNITLVSATPVPESALLDMLESLLDAQGIAMLKGANGIYRVGSAAQLRKDVAVTPGSGSVQRGYGVQIVPLKYLSAAEAVKILEPLGLKDNILRVDSNRNILMLAASGPQMSNALRTLQMFDVDVLKGMSFGIYEMINLDPELVVERFNAMLANPELEGMSSSIKLLAMSEIRSVMVIAPQAEQLATVGDWIKRFDQVGVDDSAPGSQMYVYNVQNGEAATLAGLLGQLFGASANAAGSASQTSGTTAPGLGQSEIGSGAGSSSLSSTSNTSSLGSSRSGRSRSSGAAGVTGMVTENGSRIVADESTNSLLIMAEPKEWRAMRSALTKLDKTPAQVLVEVSIWEVTLSDDLKYGVEWFFNSQTGGDGTVGGGRLSLDNQLGRIGTGFSYVFTGNDWRSVINLLSSKSNVKSLSSPSVLVLDNREATIQVGTQQPISTGTTSFPTSGTPTTTQNFSLKDTGVQLTVRPRVNAGGLVVMDIQQEVTDIGSQPDPVTGQSTFLKRAIESSVAIQSGDTIILGGLIQDNTRTGDAGIPYLHTLPFVGPLFGYKTETGARTELLVTISPRAVNRYRDFDRIGEAFRDKMRGITESFRDEFSQ